MVFLRPTKAKGSHKMSAKTVPRSTRLSQNEAWSKSDKACLQRTIDPLHNAFRMVCKRLALALSPPCPTTTTTTTIQRPFAFMTSEGTALLCAPPSEIYERLMSFLSNVSVISGDVRCVRRVRCTVCGVRRVRCCGVVCVREPP